MNYLTFSKHVKFREENDLVFICDCKRLLDFKVDLDFLNFMKQIQNGICESDLKRDKERKFLTDLKKTGLLADLEIKPLPKNMFKAADLLLENELYQGKRPRTYRFLLDKFKKYPQFFLGAFLNDELVGIVQGFPREDYLLMSEIAVIERMRGRMIGKRLVKAFEDTAKKNAYKKIKLGGRDSAIKFYLSLNYRPSVFLQFREKEFTSMKRKKLKKHKIMSERTEKGMTMIEIESKKAVLDVLKRLKKELKPHSIQYLFTKYL